MNKEVQKIKAELEEFKKNHLDSEDERDSALIDLGKKTQEVESLQKKITTLKKELDKAAKD